MNHWHSIRYRANKIHRELFAAAEPLELKLDAEEILGRLEAETGISRERVSRNDPILQKAVALIVPDFEALFFNNELSPSYAALCQAHEFGHYFLHHGEAHCSEKDIDFTGLEDSSVPTGENRIAGYSSRERREREANLFAVELLFPSEILRWCFVEKGWRAKDLVLKTGFGFDLICRQLNYALLVSDAVTPEDGEYQKDAAAERFELDPSQKRSARFDGRKMLVEAGPGTGKTRTLIGRILYLLEKGVKPENILALTFSNKAAEEMRERIAASAPAAAPRLWLGTFHAFGLEILRKYGHKIGIGKEFELLDPIDAGLLLENHLLELGLEHYKNLHAPAQNLKSIHTAIQRAKDELAGPADYEREARRMSDVAADEKETPAAEKALEVARIYRFYEQLLAENGWLDLGDLIYRAVLLLRDDAETREILQRQYTHILVDEFQDVNRASSRLLAELSGPDGNLWIVGDARQTVYRWRGASAANLKMFRDDFPEAEHSSLEINYRSAENIVRLLSEFAPHVVPAMNTEDFRGWEVPAEKRETENGRIEYLEAPDFPTESEFIAREILKRKESGRSFKEIAILGRTNNILAKVADELIAREIPVLYLGNMFERPEIRDLLSLLSLTVENRGRHLLRLIGFSEYDLSTEAVRRLIAAAENEECLFPDAFALAEADGELPDEAKVQFENLAGQFLDLDESVTAWQFYSSYLFDRSDYLLPILREDSVAVRQQRFAVYQLLQFALSEENKSAKVRARAVRNPRKRFLKLIRHLAQSGEEAAFRKLPVWAENIEAVRILTVHAAKGLEFPCVFMPYLGNAYFPNRLRNDPCPLPKGLLPGGERDEKEEHIEEERCLFFVAMSRAEENLCLSRAENYGSSSKQSRFLDVLEENLPAPFRPESIVPKEETDISDVFEETKEDESSRYAYSFYEVKTYHTCPRRYFYEYVLNLRGDAEEEAFVQFHGAVREVIGWTKNRLAGGGEVSDTKAVEKLLELWNDKPVSRHAYSPLYFSEAENLVRRAVGFLAGQKNRTESSVDATSPLEFGIGGKRIRLYPDLIEVSPEDPLIKVRKIKTGRPKKEEKELSDDEKLTIAALFQATRETFPEKEIEAAYEYIAAAERFTYTPTNIKTQLKHLERAVEGIMSRRFEPKINPRNCPRCPHYFICPGGDPA
jgi:DNA helicase II / ATP-dependent DNA helicase PcrA